MTTVTIPKQLAAKGDLIVVSREEYESMKARMVPEYTPTATERRRVQRARVRMHKNRAEGKMLTLDDLKRKLDLARKR